ncbi:HVO_2901 family zinc finger protein [Haloplanus sp. GCM10025708]|uniref:HVO_2901 family zinc finger protein n=1 Tax=Haloferacaceae TaxID=1644056 RepID=UPI0036083EFA
MRGTQLSKERGRDLLACRNCGAEFPEGRATKDGWYYQCPECEEGEGLGDGLRRV